MSDASEAFRQRAVELGHLSEEDSQTALAAFWQKYAPDGGEPDADFPDYLLEEKLISLEQMSELVGEDDYYEEEGEDFDGAFDMTLVGTPDEDPLIGQEFSGCRVVSKLGQGGMGSVYIANDPSGREVVVKFLAPEQVNNATWRGRFLREGEVMRRIGHPNIVGVFSVDGGEVPHIVMELVRGTPLDEALDQRECFEPMEACRIARDIATGLAHAHAGGVVHRDIKPANVLLSHEGVVKVLDFGLAKNVEVDDGLSLPGQILGTPHYMAPEQWGDHAVDARCDVFSLGATLYHLVTGSVPYPGKTPNAISRKVLAGEYEPPSTFVPDIPRDLELVIFRTLAVQRRYRYPNAKQVAEDLQRVLDGQQVEVPRLMEYSTKGPMKRHALLPGESFVLGRDDENNIVVRDRSVSRQHARIERGKTGFVLHDLGSTYGTFVGGMRIRNVVLKNKDEIKLGKIAFQFRDGGLSELSLVTRRITAERLRVRALPIPFVTALIEDADRRVVLGLLEDMAPDAFDRRIDDVRTQVRLRLGGELGETVGKKLTGKLKRRRMRVPHYLFTITHENLSDDVEAWLAWWDHARSNFPPQIAPQGTSQRVMLRVTKGEPDTRVIPLEKHRSFSVGRDEKSRVQLRSRSVSRHHATILRYHSRLAIRDEGSRFGTVLNGNRIKLAFLQPGDTIALGKVEMTFEVDDADSSTTVASEGEGIPIDGEAFFVLGDLRHPSTAAGFMTFLDLEEDTSWVHGEARALFPKDPEMGMTFAAKVIRQYDKYADVARKRLAEILGEDKGEDLAGWRELFLAREPSLPAIQFLPQGWFPSTTDSGTFKL